MSTYLRVSKIPLALALLFALSNASAASDTIPPSPTATATQPAENAAANNPKSAISDAEKNFRNMLGLDKIWDITYRDEKGDPLTWEEFITRANGGSSFDIVKLPSGNKPSSAVLSLTNKDATKEAQVATYKIKPGDYFPHFHATQVDGTALDVGKFTGHYTLVNFYFAQCSPCVKEVPELNALALRHQDMRFVAITSDQKSDTKQFIADTKFAWEIAPNSLNLIKKIGVKAYPAFALLDPRGKVVGIATGAEIANTDTNVESWVNRLTGGTATR